jgi:hypothetical protein
MIRAAKMAADGGKGMLSFVGVGPGDPELVTLKAVRALEAADLIALPDSGAGEGAAEKIAEAWIRGKEKLRLPMPMCGERGDWRATTAGAEALWRAFARGAHRLRCGRSAAYASRLHDGADPASGSNLVLPRVPRCARWRTRLQGAGGEPGGADGAARLRAVRALPRQLGGHEGRARPGAVRAIARHGPRAGWSRT